MFIATEHSYAVMLIYIISLILNGRTVSKLEQ